MINWCLNGVICGYFAFHFHVCLFLCLFVFISHSVWIVTNLTHTNSHLSKAVFYFERLNCLYFENQPDSIRCFSEWLPVSPAVKLAYLLQQNNRHRTLFNCLFCSHLVEYSKYENFIETTLKGLGFGLGRPDGLNTCFCQTEDIKDIAACRGRRGEQHRQGGFDDVIKTRDRRGKNSCQKVENWNSDSFF